MEKITGESTLFEINEIPEFLEAKNRLIGGGADLFTKEAGNISLLELQELHPTWAAADIIYGLENLQRVARSRAKFIYIPDESKSEVCLYYLPAKNKTKDYYYILNAGGAYGAVCTLVEALPVAARLNEMGIDCFCLNYTTAKMETFEMGLMPKPLEDLAGAWKYIHEHEKELDVNAENYYVAGFSAGGHLAAMWGTLHLGARSYQIPQAKGLILAYPLVSLETISDIKTKEYMEIGMFGKEKAKLLASQYEVDKHIDEKYPPTYLVQCMDDKTVPPVNADLLEISLKQMNVKYLVERFEKGDHGFGLGSVAPGSEWVNRAILFMNETR